MGIFKRNLGCLTFLMNRGSLSMQEILNDTQLPEAFEYELRDELVNIQVRIAEFMVCNAIEEQSLVTVKGEGRSVELWATNNGFQIRFYVVNGSGLLELAKTVKADLFIREFTTKEEFFRYLADFALTMENWLKGEVVPTPEPEHRDVALTELLADRLSKTEKELQQTKEKLVDIEQQTKEMHESIKMLIGITEKLYLKKGGN